MLSGGHTATQQSNLIEAIRQLVATDPDICLYIC